MTPAPEHGSVAVFKLDDGTDTLQDISAYLDTNGLADTIETVEVSHMGDTAKEYIFGLEDHTFNLSGHLDPTIDAQLYAIKRLIVDFNYYPFGSSGGAGTNVMYAGQCIITSIQRSNAMNAAVTFTANGQVTGPVTRSLV